MLIVGQTLHKRQSTKRTVLLYKIEIQFFMVHTMHNYNIQKPTFDKFKANIIFEICCVNRVQKKNHI